MILTVQRPKSLPKMLFNAEASWLRLSHKLDLRIRRVQEYSVDLQVSGA